MVNVLTDERADALRRRLDIPDLRSRPSVGSEPTGAVVAAPRPRAPLPRHPRALAKAVARRYVIPAARPMLHRVAARLAPTVSSMVSAQILGRLEPEISRLAADVEVMKAEVAAMAAEDRDAAAGAISRDRRRLEDLTHRLNQLEQRVDQAGPPGPTG